MSWLLHGFADELEKLGRAMSPAEKDLQANQRATFPTTPPPPKIPGPPAPTSPTGGPTGPIQQTPPRPATGLPATKAPKPPDPMRGQSRETGFYQTPRRAPPRVATVRSLPSNAQPATAGGLQAIGQQEMWSPPKEKRSLRRRSPVYTPKPAPEPEPVAKKPGRRKGKAKPPAAGPDRLRYPFEGGRAFLERTEFAPAGGDIELGGIMEKEKLTKSEAKARHRPNSPEYKARAWDEMLEQKALGIEPHPAVVEEARAEAAEAHKALGTKMRPWSTVGVGSRKTEKPTSAKKPAPQPGGPKIDWSLIPGSQEYNARFGESGDVLELLPDDVRHQVYAERNKLQKYRASQK
jgi:hypothetical protein